MENKCNGLACGLLIVDGKNEAQEKRWFHHFPIKKSPKVARAHAHTAALEILFNHGRN